MTSEVAAEDYLRVKLDGLKKVLDHQAYLRSIERMRREAGRMQQGTRRWLFDMVGAWLATDIDEATEQPSQSSTGNPRYINRLG